MTRIEEIARRAGLIPATPDEPTEPAAVTVAGLTMQRVALGEQFAAALDAEMHGANDLGAAAPGWPDLQHAAAWARKVCDPQHISRALAENELRAHNPREAA